MTEKRFTYDFVSVDCPMFYDNKEVIDYDDVVDCLNEQHEQIERLKRNFKALDEVKCELAEENEQLKSRIEYLERKIQRERNSTQKQYAKWEKEAETKIKELSKENEQLKKEIEELKWNLELER